MQGPSGDTTRGGGNTIAVLFCALYSALSAGCRRDSRQIELVESGHAKGDVDRSDAYVSRT